MKRHRAAEFDKGNRAAALIILGDTTRYPVGGALERWARLWTANHPHVARRWQHAPTAADGGKVRRSGEQMEMFEKPEAA